MLDTIAADIGRGWNAPFGTLMTGTLAALAASGPAALALGLLGAGPGTLVAVAGVVHLAATYWIAGRHERRAGH